MQGTLSMSMTNTQTQIMKQHFIALRASLLQSMLSRKLLDPPHAEIVASLINELGPQSCSAIAECVALSRHTFNDCCPDDIDCICDTLDKLDVLLTECLETETPPDGRFRDLFAKLLEKIGPYLIEALIGFLMRPQPPARMKYCDVN